MSCYMKFTVKMVVIKVGESEHLRRKLKCLFRPKSTNSHDGCLYYDID